LSNLHKLVLKTIGFYENTMKKLATNTGVMILAIIAVSGISLYFNVDTLFSQASKDSQTHAGALMVGNVQVVVKDESGNIIAYRQGSNHIVATGMQLIGQQVFGSGASGNNSNVTGGGYIEWMEIGVFSGAIISGVSDFSRGVDSINTSSGRAAIPTIIDMNNTPITRPITDPFLIQVKLPRDYKKTGLFNK